MISQLGNKIYGYASVFDIVDQHNDIIAKGSFAKSIELFYQGKRIVLLWQHQFDQPIGVID
jgi:HK97 family phage prohead protease